MTPFRLLPILILLTACGGGEPGMSTTPTVTLVLSTIAGDSQTAKVTQALPVPIQVKLTGNGDPVVGQTIHFAPTGGSGTATAPNVITGADGIASTGWTLGTTAGVRGMTVTAPGANVPALHLTATALPGDPALFEIALGDDQSQQVNAVFPFPLQVRLQDIFGNPISGVAVSWADSGQVQLAGTTSLTAADGRASMAATAGSSTGTASVTASVAALPDTLRFGLTVTPVPTPITVHSNFFSPDSVTIPAGGAVKWSWVGGPHNVTQSTGPTTFQSSSDLNSGATFGPLVLTVPGTYTYHCTIHSGMNGKIVVQ
jgi:plastocyanin